MLYHHPRKICCPEFDDTGRMPCRHRGGRSYDHEQMNIYYMLAVFVLGYALGYLYKQNCLLKSEIENMKMGQNDQNSGLKPSEEIQMPKSTEPTVPEIDFLTEPKYLNNSPKTYNSYEENLESAHRRQFIREMMRNSWNAYYKYAWGYEALKPVTNEPSGSRYSDRSILASMSTLWVMGMTKEFEQARYWIQNEMDLTKVDQYVNVFSVVSDYIGGLLSCFALTGDRMFVDKAQKIAEIIKPAYRSKTGLPYSKIRPKNSPNDINLTEIHDQVSLTDISAQLEYHYLANITNDPQYGKPIESLWQFIRNVPLIPRVSNLYGLTVKCGFWVTCGNVLWEHLNEFSWNLLKSYIQTGKTNEEVFQWYRDWMLVTLDDGSDNARERKHECEGKSMKNSNNHTTMDDSARRYSISSCLLGAMLSLTSSVMKDDKEVQFWMEKAQNVTDGCQEVSDITKTGLFPAVYNRKSTQQDPKYSLSSQIAQSNFILWRLTHNQKYRDYAWKMVKSIHKHCRTESGGYSSIENVDQVPTVKTNIQPPHFLSATLKYLYLTFTPDSVLPLDQWVFNSAGHPLPICGTNRAYPNC